MDSSLESSAGGAQEPERPKRVGVLFVHGIGQQEPGETLVAFGEPLWRWLRDRSGQLFTPHYRTRILRSALREPVLQPGQPAHFTFDIASSYARQEKPPPESRWTFAESCWAGEFRNPPFGRLARWMIGVGAWMILSHYGKQVRQRLSGWRRWLFGGPALLIAVLLALLMQILVAVLAILAILPIPRLRGWLSGLLRLLTGTLGDSYVLISSPVQEAAAIARLKSDLSWLAERVDDVFVVAHSQGAAIAHQALRSERPANLRRLLTFGSGLDKLEELRFLSLPDQRGFYWQVQMGLPLTAASLALLPRAFGALGGFPDSPIVAAFNAWALLIFVSPLAILGFILRTAWRGRRSYLDHLAGVLPLPGLDWHDCFSAADPVPNGPLTAAGEAPPTVESRVVRNLDNLLLDHSAYWQNRDEFITWMAATIDAAAGTGLVPERALRVSSPAAARSGRIALLRGIRWSVLASFIVALISLRDRLSGFAEGLEWPDWLARLPGMEAVLGTIAALLGLLTGTSRDLLAALGASLLGVALVAGGFLIPYLLATAAWSWWNELMTDRFFGRDQAVQIWLAVTCIALASLAPPIFAGAAFYTTDPVGSLTILAGAMVWLSKAVGAVLFLGLLLSLLYLLIGTWQGVDILVAILKPFGALGRLLRRLGRSKR